MVDFHKMLVESRARRHASFTAFSDPEPEGVTLTFGKHKGVPLNRVETSYLEWVKTADRITPDLKAAIDTELRNRAPAAPDRYKCPSPVSENVVSLAELIVEAGRSELEAAFGVDQDFQAAVALLKTHLMLVVTDDGGPVF